MDISRGNSVKSQLLKDNKLQAYCHIRRNTQDVIIYSQIPWMNDIAPSNSAFIFFPKPQQGFRGVMGAGLDLNRI